MTWATAAQDWLFPPLLSAQVAPGGSASASLGVCFRGTPGTAAHPHSPAAANEDLLGGGKLRGATHLRLAFGGAGQGGPLSGVDCEEAKCRGGDRRDRGGD